MNKDTFMSRTAQAKQILNIVRDAIGPTSFDSARHLANCSPGSLSRLLNRENQDYGSFRQSGPPSVKLSGLALAQWLAKHLPERTNTEWAELLRGVADKIEKG